MRCPCFLSLVLLLALAACTAEPAGRSKTNPVAPTGTPTALLYPHSPTVDVVDEIHGTRVPDPYRWLEDLDSPQVRGWIAAQNDLTFSFLAAIPERQAIKDRLTRLWDYERCGIPVQRGGRYFYTRNDGLQNQSVLYVQQGPDSEPRILLDPNALSADGTIALAGLAVSEDGKRIAYGLSSAGSDWEEWRVRDVESCADLPDHLKWIKFHGASWSADGRGFFYSRFDEPRAGKQLEDLNYYNKLYYHEIGRPQSDDVLIYRREDQKEWSFGGAVTDDGRYLVITVRRGTDPRNGVFYRDNEAPDRPVVELLRDFDASYDFIDNDGSLFWFQTDLSAPRGRVIAIDLAAPERVRWREVIPERRETLVSASVVHDSLIAVYLEDAHSRATLFDLQGRRIRDLELPGLGTAGGFGGRRRDAETFFSFASFTQPPTVYRLDLESGVTGVFHEPEVKFDRRDFETRQIFYTSKDGTRIPMFISHRRGLVPDGKLPTVLYGYGGFNISMTPTFSPATLAWMELGGVHAVPSLRGGGEYGEEWHQAGTKQKKQNVFDDFLAAAEWLISSGYTSPSRLAILGGSNGGLLVGACMTQRPDLFGAALPAVGVLDMLRFHKFTIGWAWTSDFGSPDDPEDFKVLRAYSPLHNLKPGAEYPATLITTADHDDRVVPAHSFKFAAALQAAQAGAAPVLIRIETSAGHGGGKPTSKAIEEVADRWTFLYESLGMRER